MGLCQDRGASIGMFILSMPPGFTFLVSQFGSKHSQITKRSQFFSPGAGKSALLARFFPIGAMFESTALRKRSHSQGLVRSRCTDHRALAAPFPRAVSFSTLGKDTATGSCLERSGKSCLSSVFCPAFPGGRGGHSSSQSSFPRRSRMEQPRVVPLLAGSPARPEISPEKAASC